MRAALFATFLGVLFLGCNRSPGPSRPVSPPLPESVAAEQQFAASDNEPRASDEANDEGNEGELLEYLELTTAGASPHATLPMVVAIHGYGDSPEGIAGLFRSLQTPTRLILPRGPHLHPRRGHSWYTLDGESTAEEISAAASRIADLVNMLSTTRPTEGEPVVTGFSQGGMLSFTLAVEHDGLFSVAFPLAGRLTDFGALGEPSERETRIHAFHGDADDRVPLMDAQTSVDALTAGGWDVLLTVVPNLGHQINTELRSELHGAISREWDD